MFTGGSYKGWQAKYELDDGGDNYKVTLYPAPGYSGTPVVITKDNYN